MTSRRRSTGPRSRDSQPHDDADRAAVADHVAIDVESAGADLHNAVDALADVVWRATGAVRSARDAGWTADRVDAAVDLPSARARLSALDRALAAAAGAASGAADADSTATPVSGGP